MRKTHFIRGGLVVLAIIVVGVAAIRLFHLEKKGETSITAENSALPVRVEQARKGPIREWVLGEGIARTVRREFLTFGQAGKVMLIGKDEKGQVLREGSRVYGPKPGEQFGQVLAQLDQRELLATIDMLNAEREQARQNVIIAKATVTQTQTRFNLARADFERVKRLSKEGTTLTLYEEELTQAQQAAAAARSEVFQAESALNLVRAERDRVKQLSTQGTSLRGYEEALTQTRQNVAVAEATLTQAKNDAQLAKSHYEKTERLHKDGVLPRVNLDEANTAFLNAKAALKTAEANLQAAQSQVSTAENDLHTARITIPVAETKTAEANYRNAKAALDTARANVKAAESQVKSAETRLNQAKIDLPVVEYETARSTYLTAEAELETAEANFQTAQAMVDGASARLRQAQVALEQASLFAPFDGIITYLNIKAGEYVTAFSLDKTSEQDMSETAHIVMINPDEYEITLHLPAYSGTLVTPDMDALIVPGDLAVLQELEDELLDDEIPNDAPDLSDSGKFFPMVAEGQVYSISPSISPGGRSIQIKIRSTSGAEYLQDGMFVACPIAVNESQNAVLVPVNSLLFRENTAHVFVADPDTGLASRREVLTGLEGTRYIEIRSGVEEGELIVTEGQQRLVDGTRIELIQSEGGPTP